MGCFASKADRAAEADAQQVTYDPSEIAAWNERLKRFKAEYDRCHVNGQSYNMRIVTTNDTDGRVLVEISRQNSG